MSHIQYLRDRREEVDRLFLEYAAPNLLRANIISLGNLALIGDRLDKMIREETGRNNGRIDIGKGRGT